MTEFEQVLQECLHDLDAGVASVEECLSMHPKHARELEPVLLTSTYLARGAEMHVSDPFKARVRTRLIQQMNTHPRKASRPGILFMRFATGLAVLMLAFLAAGTAYAQSAMPGDPFYTWKLVSENAWRAVSPDPVATDIAIAERRVDELIAVRDEPALYTEVLQAYVEVTDRLKSEMDAESEALILAVLETQIEELNQSDVILPQPDQEILPPLEQPTLTPVAIPTATPLPVLQTPQTDPTGLPQILPTIDVSEPTLEVPEVVLPTVEDVPDILPTVELPLPIP
ncbi:MAG TPA: hypothetical protein VK897_22295 [Anaerolineales bacterium]|nr:hypothetical protein [Anaerolineales bacterium]